MNEARAASLLPESPSGEGWLSVFSPTATLSVAGVLAGLIGLLDYWTGYEVRLGSLYLFPIALATWRLGSGAGFSVAVGACLCWLTSFSATHGYGRAGLFYWDGVVMGATFALFVLLLARLRTTLSSADARFARLLEEMESAVYVVDRTTGSILYANRKLANMLPGQTRFTSAADLPPCFRAGPAGDSAADNRSSAPASGFTSRERRDHNTGRWHLVQSGPIPWHGGLSVILNVVSDITDRRHAEQLRREHQDMLFRTARLSALAEITSALAHEINQPLMAIASYSGACLRLLDHEPDNRVELVHALKKSRSQALRAGEILRRMRDFVRSRHPRPEPCDLNSVIREAVELLGPRFEDNEVVPEIVLEESLPSLCADRLLLVQVVVNLIDNAFDAMRERQPSGRRLVLSTVRQADGTARVAVADNGEGVASEVAELLYTPFQSRKPTGLGLGLSICRSVVEAHGGRLWHEPNPGGGAVFCFTVGGHSE
jgi:C4-dicarboxylate-specific signal transduction histidine kinase